MKDLDAAVQQTMSTRPRNVYKQQTRLFSGTHRDFARNYLGCNDQQIEEMGLNIKKNYVEGAVRTVRIGSPGTRSSDELALSTDHFDDLT